MNNIAFTKLGWPVEFVAKGSCCTKSRIAGIKDTAARIRLEGDTLFVLDETMVPKKVSYIPIKNYIEAARAIKQMKTRAFGQVLVCVYALLLTARKNAGKPHREFLKSLAESAKAIEDSRPTFPFNQLTGMVLGWAQAAAKKKGPIAPAIERNIEGFVFGIKAKKLERAKKVAKLIKKSCTILTHCNTSGELVTAAQIARQAKKKLKFIATETRPYMQGSRLTAWELKEAGFDVTLIADNAVADVMSKGMVDIVIVGSDRSNKSGDIINKVGTYQIALCAKEFNIPFYAMTQQPGKDKFDKTTYMEVRPEEELLEFNGKRFAPKGVKGYYPSFDITAANLITETIRL